MARAISLSVSLTALLVVGCALPDEHHACRTDDDCTSGRFCVAAQCLTVRPDAAEMDVAVEAAIPDAAANEAARADVAADAALDEHPRVDATVDAAPDQVAPADAPTDVAPDEAAAADAPMDVTAFDAASEAAVDAPVALLPPRLSAGGFTTCLRTPDSRVVCWGRQAAPPVSGTLVVVNDGRIYVRHRDGRFAVISDARDPRLVPTEPIEQLAVSATEGCGIHSDGTLTCWAPEHLVDGITAQPGHFQAVAVGDAHVCAVHDDGAILCWGSNEHGQATAPAGRFSRVVALGDSSCALRDDGVIVCWGAKPLAVGQGLTTLALGGDRVCGLTTDGEIRCWDDAGALQPTPDGSFVDVAAGSAHACAVRADDRVTCWGNNDDWQIGPPRGLFRSMSFAVIVGCTVSLDGDLTCWGQSRGPGRLPLPPAPAGKYLQVVVVNDQYACALREDHTAVCWGTAPDGHAPPPAEPLRELGHPCAVRMDGTLACWGAAITPPTEPITALSQNDVGACGLRPNGTILCFATRAGSPAPTPPEGEFVEVALREGDGNVVCGRRADGTVACTTCVVNASITCGFPFPSSRLPKVPVHHLGTHMGCMCGLNDQRRLTCWNALYEIDCEPVETKTGEVVDFSTGCVVDGAGVLFCATPARTIDLEDP